MRAEVHNTPNEYAIDIMLHPEDGVEAIGQVGVPIELVTDTATVQVPEPQSRPHPDLVALAVLTIVEPWCSQRLEIEGGVSRHFAQAAHDSTGIEVGPVDEALAPRTAGNRFGLMFSGGPDCMAAEVLIGERMPYFHFRRVKHPRIPDRMTHVRGDVQERIVTKARDAGEEVHIARSDLEYLCLPFATFPQWASVTVGAVLQADSQDLGGIVTGRNISGLYLTWGGGFNPDGDRESAWHPLFAAAGLPVAHPVGGATDYVTKAIAESHRLAQFARSCLLGSDAAPCGVCEKCLTNDVIHAARHQTPLGPQWSASRVTKASLVHKYTGPPPYQGQFLFEYALPRIPDIDQTFLADMNSRLDLTPSAADWVEKYYSPTLTSHVSAPLRDAVHRSVEQRIGFMTPDQEESTRSWDPLARRR
jgi:hypothetical protein